MLAQFFQYSFLTRALFAGLSLSIAGSLLGVVLTLKHYSMIADGLSHASFAAIVASLVLGAQPLLVSIPLCIVLSCTLLLLQKNHIDSDALVALVSTSSLAVGILISSVTTGLNTDVSGYMFGSILSVTKGDLVIAIITGVAVLLFFIIFSARIFCVTFDEGFAKTCGVRAVLYNFLFAVLTSVTIVVGMRLLGSLMISAVVIFPALSSFFIAKSFKVVIVLSVVLGVACFLIGIVAAFLFSLPVGSVIVIVQLLALAICAIISKIR